MLFISLAVLSCANLLCHKLQCPLSFKYKINSFKIQDAWFFLIKKYLLNYSWFTTLC